MTTNMRHFIIAVSFALLLFVVACGMEGGTTNSGTSCFGCHTDEWQTVPTPTELAEPEWRKY